MWCGLSDRPHPLGFRMFSLVKVEQHGLEHTTPLQGALLVCCRTVGCLFAMQAACGAGQGSRCCPGCCPGKGPSLCACSGTHVYHVSVPEVSRRDATAVVQERGPLDHSLFVGCSSVVGQGRSHRCVGFVTSVGLLLWVPAWQGVV